MKDKLLMHFFYLQHALRSLVNVPSVVAVLVRQLEGASFTFSRILFYFPCYCFINLLQQLFYCVYVRDIVEIENEKKQLEEVGLLSLYLVLKLLFIGKYICTHARCRNFMCMPTEFFFFVGFSCGGSNPISHGRIGKCNANFPNVAQVRPAFVTFLDKLCKWG